MRGFKEFGVRTADILIATGKGDTEKLGKEIFTQNSKNVLSMTARIGNPDVNIMAQVVYKSTEELHSILENIRGIHDVSRVEWSEIVKEIGDSKNNYSDIVDNLLSK